MDFPLPDLSEYLAGIKTPVPDFFDELSTTGFSSSSLILGVLGVFEGEVYETGVLGATGLGRRAVGVGKSPLDIELSNFAEISERVGGEGVRQTSLMSEESDISENPSESVVDPTSIPLSDSESSDENCKHWTGEATGPAAPAVNPRLTAAGETKSFSSGSESHALTADWPNTEVGEPSLLS